MIRKLVVTEDGSHTLRVDELNEHYHSTFGAINESRHVFIEAGLHHLLDREVGEISILEVGFGTGLNALLTLLDTKVKDVHVNYTALEAFPLDEDTWSALNYAEILGSDEISGLYQKTHTSTWGEPTEIRPGFMLEKAHIKLEGFASSKKFDLVYFDAFGPDVQPELWTEQVFRQIARMTTTGGILVTYSCKGLVRRALKAAGYSIEKIPGPTGKREMLRGTKTHIQ